MRNVTIVFMSVLVLFSMVFNSSSVNAQKNNGSQYLDEVEEQLQYSKQIESSEEINRYTQKSKKQIESGAINTHTNNGNLDYKKATLVKYRDVKTNEEYLINNIPVSLDNGHELSNIGVIYEKNGDLFQYVELYLTNNDEGNFNVTMYTDNEKTLEKDTNEKFMTAAEYKQRTEGTPQLNFDKSKLAKCLGISLGLADVIGLGCIGVCAITAGAGCIACVAGLAGFAIGGNGSCVVAAFK